MKRTCALTKTIALLSKKWTLLIIKSLSEGKKTFHQLMIEFGSISTATLSKRLKELKKEGIISSKRIYGVPPKNEYCLTEKGQELVKIFSLLAKWSEKHKTT